ncbi:uncharacterized protein LOC116125509 [Pistacia vera]|uniref:uncharacterized protein LOC116125509 n=1 Tax=Pistacia vera TaxID=55513 RepID=UPI0012634CB9|nr:uncharacterized protein LOC116125509 [Pistacia vera]
MIFEIDGVCLENCRMDRKAFFKLCNLLESRRGLVSTRHTSIEEIVGSFLHILVHHVKYRVMKRQISRSGETLSRKFHIVLKLHSILLKKSEPIPENSTDECWRWFKNCLGALDGTYIRVHVDASDKPRYRTRKGEIATNVLGVCSPDMQFIYVLPRWEGSAIDGRVLRDAISRRNDLKVPQGCYYLCDSGYTNGEGFLAPYRGQRYHLNDWRSEMTIYPIESEVGEVSNTHDDDDDDVDGDVIWDVKTTTLAFLAKTILYMPYATNSQNKCQE